MFFHITSTSKKIRTLQFHAGFIFINEVSIVKLELYYHELRFIALHPSQLLFLYRSVSGFILASGHGIDLRLKCILLLMWNSCEHNAWNVVSSNEIGSRAKKHEDIASNWRHCIIFTWKSIVFFFLNCFCRVIEGVDWVWPSHSIECVTHGKWRKQNRKANGWNDLMLKWLSTCCAIHKNKQ